MVQTNIKPFQRNRFVVCESFGFVPSLDIMTFFQINFLYLLLRLRKNFCPGCTHLLRPDPEAVAIATVAF